MSNHIILKAKSEDGTFEIIVEEGSNSNVLRIIREGELIAEHKDGGQSSFLRDYMWIVDALVDAYNYGYNARGYNAEWGI